jgi:hypothetical protein
MAGLKAAHERMFSDKGLRKPEYPRSLLEMYSNIEDELFALYESVQSRKYIAARENAADVIVTASEIVEHAELLAETANKPWDTED